MDNVSAGHRLASAGLAPGSVTDQLSENHRTAGLTKGQASSGPEFGGSGSGPLTINDSLNKTSRPFDYGSSGGEQGRSPKAGDISAGGQQEQDGSRVSVSAIKAAMQRFGLGSANTLKEGKKTDDGYQFTTKDGAVVNVPK